ncbi:MAG: alpha/beta fold hydrolase [Desulfobacterales bacterium]|nr:alpha/beta fold hydrolase [Desulfobacterales bacterium]
MNFIIRITTMVLIIIYFLSSKAFTKDISSFAELGDYTLENGEVIRDCILGYRTFGNLNSDKSNAVLFPTWLVGTSKDLSDLGIIGQGKMADSSKYFIIAVDALGNGVSSSPSNSKYQQGKTFPQFTINDIVKTQYILITKHLKIQHLFGIIGISMGGMTTLQWMVSYPGFMEKAVAIAASPRLTSYDLLLLQAELSAIESSAICGEKEKNNAMKTVAAIHTLHSRTPAYILTNTSLDKFPQFLSSTENIIMKYDPYNWAWQLKAIMNHDIYKKSGKSEEQIAKFLKINNLLIWAEQDNMINPEPLKKFADLINSETFVLKGNCGHFAFLCEIDMLSERVKRFFEKRNNY